ncbi:hypothetical protein HDU97_006574 [Phlyctochytrium planicorne]|nr:hypothetical protein HDU97_006574 [Phlyctochytrium planicorne]
MTTFLKFVGPGFMIGVGYYLDPGNWSTDLAAGSQFGYTLLHVILLANLMAILLQYLSIKLGVITNQDLAMACRTTLPSYFLVPIYVLCEIAIVATDLAEVIGTAVSLRLLFGIPVQWGVVVTALDVLVVLAAWGHRRVRLFEGVIGALVVGVAGCFGYLVFKSQPVWRDVVEGLLPTERIFKEDGMLYLAMGIVGATIMPHNLYIHSSIVRYRSSQTSSNLGEICDLGDEELSSTPDLISRHQSGSSIANIAGSTSSNISSPSVESQGRHKIPTSPEDNGSNNIPEKAIEDVVSLQPKWRREMIPQILWYTNMDSILALTLALLINGSILVVASAAFHDRSIGSGSLKGPGNNGTEWDAAELGDAYELLRETLGYPAAVAFAVALLFAGQSSTITGTIAGQVVMEGFLGIGVGNKVKADEDASGESANGEAVPQQPFVIPPWLLRLSTRVLAIVPAMIVASMTGESGMNRLLVASQVVLSLQLPFAVWPLVAITSSKRWMTVGFVEEESGKIEKECFANGWMLTGLAWLVAGLITAFNGVLVWQVVLG